MNILRVGSSGPEVRQLQERLNATLRPSPGLAPDGRFGPLTRTAVIRFQNDNRLVADGEVGPCTWNAVTGAETYRPIFHPLSFIPQPTPTTCWAASTAMVTRTTVPGVIARTPRDLILADGSLANFSEGNPMELRRFAQPNGLTVLAPMSWMPAGLKALIMRGPLIFDMLWNASEYARGRGSSGHMIAVVGMRGDDDQSGRGTTLHIYDPWPPNTGKRYSVGYMKWVQEVPTRTYHIYHRI
jgi:hypothetical protein